MIYRRVVQFLLAIATFCFAAAAHARVTEIKFGGDPAYAPFEWIQDGRPTGFHVDLAQEMGRASNVSVSHALRPWPETVEALKTGTVDVVPMFRSDERAQHFWFSQPIYFAHHAIYTKGNPGHASRIEDLAGWRIAVERSSFGHDQFRRLGREADLVLVGTTKEAVQALAAGKADYAVLATRPTEHLIQTLDLPIRQIGTPLWAREYALAVRKDRAELIDWAETSLDAVVSDGTFQRLDEQWRERSATPSRKVGFPLLWWLIPGVAALAAAIAFWFFLWGRSALRLEREMRSAAEQNADFASRHDSVTRLPNAAQIPGAVALMMRNATLSRPLELVVLKARNLEAIAKEHGRDVADGILRELASRLSNASLFAGVLGRGTYVVVLQMSQSQDFSGCLESLAESTEALGMEFAWGASRCPEHGNDVHELTHKAEVALNASIARRREWLVYEAALEPDQRDLQLIKDFERFGKEQIFAAYQPQLDLKSGKVLSAEVLARWDHPERGPIPPADFVPLLEGAGLVSHITSRMLKEAVRQSVRFRRLGLRCRFSVNLSVHDIRETDIPALVAETVSKYGGKPEDIVLELTESGAVEDPQRVRGVLQRLKNIGAGTAIDDFGTGFSSLANLVELPFDELKIDQIFVGKMLESTTHKSIIRSTIQMAHDMGLSVIAEGAEDEATILALAEKGCDRVQGYGFSKPLSADDLLRFCSMSAWRPWAGSVEQGQLKLSG